MKPACALLWVCSRCRRSPPRRLRSPTPRNWASGCSSSSCGVCHTRPTLVSGLYGPELSKEPPAATQTWSATSSATARRACRASSTPTMPARSPPSPPIVKITAGGHQPPSARPGPRRRARRATTNFRTGETPWPTPDTSQVPAVIASRSRSGATRLRLPPPGRRRAAQRDRHLGGRREDGRRHGLGQGRGLDHHHQRSTPMRPATTTSRRCRTGNTGSGRRR